MILKIHFECHFEQWQKKKTAAKTSSSTAEAASASIPTTVKTNDRILREKKIVCWFSFLLAFAKSAKWLRVKSSIMCWQGAEKLKKKKEVPQFHKNCAKWNEFLISAKMSPFFVPVSLFLRVFFSNNIPSVIEFACIMTHGTQTHAISQRWFYLLHHLLVQTFLCALLWKCMSLKRGINCGILGRFLNLPFLK